MNKIKSQEKKSELIFFILFTYIFMKLTKIICTIGPSSWDPKVMKKMIQAGMNCARVNWAFADTAELDKVTKLVRDVSDEVSLMMDVKWPEVRMNKFDQPILIKTGDEIIIWNTDKDKIYPANYSDLYKHLKPWQRIVIWDGDVELVLKKIKWDKMYCEVVFGEIFKPWKAMNLPGATFASSALTKKDIENLKHSIKLWRDFVSASFVQNAAAAREVKKYLKWSWMKLIAKIEDQLGIDNIDEILQEVDGIMIARWWLGVELWLEQVPIVQRMLIKKTTELGKIVITATQMLESMTYNPRPTRAEVNDVATAVMLWTDTVMLSWESSAGKYPVETVEFMSSICKITENVAEFNFKHTGSSCVWDNKKICVVARSVVESAQIIKAKAIVVWSYTGNTAREVRKNNPTLPILVITENKETFRQMSLLKWAYPLYFKEVFDSNKICKYSEEFSKKLWFVKNWDFIVIAAWIWDWKDPKTNTMTVYQIWEK